MLVRSVRSEGQAVGVAFEERAVPYRLAGAAAFFQRAEVRDLLAWLRLLVDPGDAGAVVRALARPPVELRAIDLARVTQIARRRKLDMVAAMGAALESPQIPPEARDRIHTFLGLYRSAAAAIDSSRPDLYVHRLVERLGLRRQLLFAASTEVVERLRNLAKFAELASAYVRRSPQATAREFARSIAAVADAGLREEEASAGDRPVGVQVMTMHAAKGLEFEHVYVLGLMASRMPGPRQRTLEPIPDALLKETLPPDTKAAHAEGMRRLLHVAMTRARTRLVLAYAQRTDRGAMQHPSPFAEEARLAVGGEWEAREEELFGPAETLQSTFRLLRDELLTTVSQVGGRLGELRFDTDLDVSHAVVRYMELLKLAALIERTKGAPAQAVEDALPEVNARLLQAATSEQREIFETSALDEYLLDAERDEKLRARAVAARTEPSLEGFLPRRGDGLLLSASDIETYRTCPLKYKFARVFRIPSEPTINQRFGILVHQVLERYHVSEASGGLPELLGLLEAGWRRGGFGDSEEERQLRAKATQALVRYHDRFREEGGEPVWFERSFQFKLGPHVLRGRVDRVDRLPEGGYELIDYKTGRPKSAAQLREDVQLSLYAVGAREAWQLEAPQQAYYYVLDDQKVPVERSEEDRDWITDTVLEVGEGIQSQGFEPTPSFAACSMCDYRIACPGSRALSRDLLDQGGQPVGLVDHRERARALDRLHARAGHLRRQALRELEREQLVVRRPGEQHRLAEGGQPARGVERDLVVEGDGEAAQVLEHAGLLEHRLHPPAREVVDVAVREHPEAERRAPRGREAHRLQRRLQPAREPRGRDQPLERARREVLVHVAVGQHERAEALRVVDRDDLAERAAGVVADQHDVVELERLEERGDDRRDAARGDVGARAHRLRMGAERPGRHDRAQPARGQLPGEDGPQVAAHQVAVDEHDRAPVARPRLFVVDGSLLELDRRHRRSLHLRTACR